MLPCAHEIDFAIIFCCPASELDADILFVVPQLPECDADLVLQAVPATQAQPPRLLSDVQSSGRGKGRRGQRPHKEFVIFFVPYPIFQQIVIQSFLLT